MREGGKPLYLRRELPLAHSKPDPEFNPYVAPQSDFETNPETGGTGALEGAGEPNYAGISKRLCAFLLDGFFIIY